jgi:hypothetical protein
MLSRQGALQIEPLRLLNARKFYDSKFLCSTTQFTNNKEGEFEKLMVFIKHAFDIFHQAWWDEIQN